MSRPVAPHVPEHETVVGLLLQVLVMCLEASL